MTPDMQDLRWFVSVAQAGGFREAAKACGVSASSLSQAVRRLEAALGIRLLNRTTRSVGMTETGLALLSRLVPALDEVGAALDALAPFRDQPAGTLRLNVPGSAARLVLPAIVAPFLRAYPQIRLEISVDESFVDLLRAGCDAGIRYEERLEQDMIALPIGPRRQRMATAASPDYLDRHGVPSHPRDLLSHACLRGRFASGAMPAWEFERDGTVVRVDPTGPLLVRLGGGADLMVDTALQGLGIVHLFEAWLDPFLRSGALLPVLMPWWQFFSGPFLYYPGRRLPPPPLRAFIDFVRARSWDAAETSDPQA